MSRSPQFPIFGGVMQSWDVEQIEEEVDQLDKKRDFLETGVRRPSAYVDVFETMVRTVLECEHHLLSDKEVEILEQFSKLCYNARYCLIRLVLRKANQWLPLSSLEKYTKEVGENGLEAAIYDICLPFGDLHEQQPVVKMEPAAADLEPGFSIKKEGSPGNLNLFEDLNADDMKPNISDSSIMTTPLKKEVFDRVWPQRAGPCQLPQPEDPIKAVLHSDRSNIQIDFFCENETVMTTQEILGRLSKELLVGLAKEMKCKVRPNSKKDDIILSLQQQASSQQILNFGNAVTKKGKGKFTDPYHQTQLPHIFVKEPKQKTNQEQRLRELATKRLGPCVRVNFDFYCLVRKLHIICYRATEHPMDLLKPALLSTFKKRNYTPYKHNRTAEAWASREDLLEYERALELDDLLDAIMKEQAPTALKRASKTPFPKGRSLATPVTPSSTCDFASPMKTPVCISFRQSAPPVLDVSEFAEQQEYVKLRKELVIKKHLEDWIYPTWQNYVASETEQGVRPRPIGLERFDPGHVFTRMVHKASQVLGPLKEYELEVETLDTLLEQRFWCRGKRAKWYTRRAVVLQHLAAAEKHPEKKRDIQWRSLEGIKTALLDDDTGIVYCPNLVKRLMALEKTLRIPLSERSQCDGKLRDAPVVELNAVRVEPLRFDVHGRLKNEKANIPELHKFLSLAADNSTATEEPAKKTGKSSWKGRGDQIVNVETRALEHYEDQGYRGFHCETRILTTIFGLLFWDVIFADFPGAFDTPYQTAPLDLLHDSFYRARKEIIDKRLQEIKDGMGYEILQKHDETLRDRSVICVGVSWDLCSREDLLDIVNCLGGNTLAIICQLFCEDYRGRSSGGPDLFIWKAKEQKCKFVEVKGPGDTPQENQRFWFDSLLRADADVEICKVIDSANSSTDSKNKKKRKRRTRPSPRETSAPLPLDYSEHEDPDSDYQGEGNDDKDVSQMAQDSNKRRRISRSEKQTSTETEI